MAENRVSQFTFEEIEEKLGTIKKDQGANKVLLGDGTYADISDAISDDAIQEAVDKAFVERENFINDIRKKGEETLKFIEENNIKVE